ncbi:hypothetical protein JCM8097_007332 [Rhodosporidiobolus ruineniae]
MDQIAPDSSTSTARVPQELIVLCGVVGSGKSTLSTRWAEVKPGWARINQDDLGDRRTCEAAVRSSLALGHSVLVDRQNFDAGQRRTWLEIGAEFEGVEVNCMVMGTSKEECRERLLVRQDHPTIGNSTLALELLDKFSSLWIEPTLDEGFDYLLTLPSLPPASEISAPLIDSLLSALHASLTNSHARAQRQPRPRPRREREPYRRPDGFVDDGTWRPPPRSYGPPGGAFGGGGHRGGYGGAAVSSGRGGYAGGGGGFGYRPPPPPAWGGGASSYAAGAGAGQGGYQQSTMYGGGQQQQPMRGGYSGVGGYGRGGGSAGTGGGQGYQWGGGQRLGGPSSDAGAGAGGA